MVTFLIDRIALNFEIDVLNVVLLSFGFVDDLKHLLV